MICLPRAKSEKTYNIDYSKLFNAAQQALVDIGCEIKYSNQKTGELKAVFKYNFLKKVRFLVNINKKGRVSVESSISMIYFSVVDIGTNLKVTESFLNALDKRVL